ncbi:MAG: hypothetical protein ABR920_18450 [Terriglobales bacterium]
MNRTLEQRIAAAAAEKVGVVETAADFFRKRAGKATGEGLMKFLRTAPKTAPEPKDTLR